MFLRNRAKPALKKAASAKKTAEPKKAKPRKAAPTSRKAKPRASLAEIPEILLLGHPKLAKQWDRRRNFNYVDGDECWWRCKEGHFWLASMYERINRNLGCLSCASQNPIAYERSLEFNFPEIAKEWAVSRNGLLLPEHVGANSDRTVWWKCRKRHLWRCRIDKRTLRKVPCPFCTGRASRKSFRPPAAWIR